MGGTIRRRTLAASFSVVLATSVVVGLSFPDLAAADPTPSTIAQAQTQLDSIEAETAELTERFATSQAQLEEAQVKQVTATADLAAQTTLLSQLNTTIGQIVNANRQTSGIDVTVRLVTSTSDIDFLSQLATIQSVNVITEERLARFASEQARLTELKDDVASAVATIKSETDQQTELLKAQQQKEDQAQSLLNRLTQGERDRLAAEQRRRDEADAAAQVAEQARQAAAVARNATPRPATSTRATTKAATAPAPEPARAAPPSGRAGQAVAFALAQVGDRYLMGGTGPNAWDCSGLTSVAYRSAGVSLPRTATAQSRVGTPVSKSDLQPGDLIFYYFPIHHVGMYIGNGMMVHASNPRTGVLVAPAISAYRPFNTARRVA